MSPSPGHRSRPSFIERSGQPLYSAATMLRLVSSLLVALALLFSPLAMTGGGAMAAPHASMVATGMDGHCAGADAPSDNDHWDAMAECAVACTSFVAVDAAISDNVPPIKQEVLVSEYASMIGVRPEGETPPPRITPEI